MKRETYDQIMALAEASEKEVGAEIEAIDDGWEAGFAFARLMEGHRALRQVLIQLRFMSSTPSITTSGESLG